jgi:hypothetical protein
VLKENSTVHFNISEDPTILPVQGLAVDATAEVRMALQSGPPCGVIIRADDGNQIVEGNEGNNILELIFTPLPQCMVKETIPH